MNKVQIKADRPENQQYRGIALAFFRMVDRQRVRSGKKLFAMRKYIDPPGVSIYARSSATPAGCLVTITGGGETPITIWGVIMQGPLGFPPFNSRPYYGQVYDIDANTLDLTTTVPIYPGFIGSDETGYQRHAQLTDVGNYSGRILVATTATKIYKDGSFVKQVTSSDFDTWLNPLRTTLGYIPEVTPTAEWWAIDQANGDQYITMHENPLGDASGLNYYSYLLKLDAASNAVTARFMWGPSTRVSDWIDVFPSYILHWDDWASLSPAGPRKMVVRNKTTLDVVTTVTFPSPSVYIHCAYERNGMFYVMTYDNPGWRIYKVDPSDSWSQTLIYANTGFIILRYGTGGYACNSLWVNETEDRIIMTYTLNSSTQTRLADLTYDEGTGLWTPSYDIAPQEYFRIQEHAAPA